MNDFLDPETLRVRFHEAGFMFLDGAATRALLPAGAFAPPAWKAFAASWDGMPVDEYMADGGRYRRRRFGVFSADGAGITRAAHQPHYQSRDYNQLHGGIERWFEPIAEDVALGATFQGLLDFTRALFECLSGPSRWHIEAHQFRIEARPDVAGQPTPEGMHRDGVDFVLVLMVRRENIAQGTTTIHDDERRLLGSLTLSQPLDAALVDDRRVYHGVTPVVPALAGRPAFRDVLVLTYRKIQA
jgi:hypothetical protein